FNYLVGEQLDRIGYLDAERSGRLHVDDELEFGRLHDRQVGGLRTFEDLTAHYAYLTKPIRNSYPVAHQPSHLGIFTSGIDRRNRVAYREHRKLHAPAGEEAARSLPPSGR